MTNKEIYRTKNGYALWVGSTNKVFLADKNHKQILYRGPSQTDSFRYLKNYLDEQKGWLGKENTPKKVIEVKSHKRKGTKGVRKHKRRKTRKRKWIKHKDKTGRIYETYEPIKN